MRLGRRIWRCRKYRLLKTLSVCGLIVFFCLSALLLAIGRLELAGGHDSSCGSPFLLSEALLPWETADSDCRRHIEPLLSRLLWAAAVLGRPPSVAFVGDSRARELHVRAVHASGKPPVPLPPRHPQQDRCLDPGSSPEHQCSLGMCSQNVSYDVVASQLVWRPQLNCHMAAVIDNMAAACGDRRPGCPDLVVVNSGIWYSYRVPVYGKTRREALLALFRHGLWQVMPAVTRLARRTRTVWKLEESMFSDFVKDKYMPPNTKSENNQLIMVEHAVVYDLAAETPELVVWSSLLPETTRHMFHVCARTRPRTWPECPDAIHMGRSLQDSFIERILGDICDRVDTGRYL